MKHHRETVLAIAVVAVLSIVVAGAYANDYYVDQSATGSGTGDSWANAFTTIQAGIDACSGTSTDYVHVAAATYTENIVMKSFIVMYGGYPPGGGARDPDANETIIDGGGADVVVKIDGKTDVIVDGFTIQNGAATDGGGIYCYESSPTIENNTITGNSAHHYGGGISCYYYSSPTIINNTITNNSANSYNGGGIYCYYYSSPTIENNTITGNSANSYGGGGIYCYYYSSPTIENNTITGNSANYNYGGGIYCYYDSSPTITCNTITGNSASCGGGIYCYYYSSPTITNNMIIKNSADVDGGGIYCYYYSSPTIENNTITGNSASDGGGLYCKSPGCEPTILNSILWGDSPNEIAGDTTHVTVTYSDVEGGWSGTGNIDEDPQFCSRGGSTNYDGYFLKQENDGEGWPSSEWSPCIDTGDPGSDPFGGSSNTEYSTAVNGFLDTNCVDMGYHYGYGGCTYIELVSFTARPVGASVVLDWETGAEIDNAGFVLYRAIAGTADYKLISDLIAAEGTPASGASYSFTDSSVEAGVTYNYWLVDIETSGKWTAHGPRMARLPIRVDSPMNSLERPSYTANYPIERRP